MLTKIKIVFYFITCFFFLYSPLNAATFTVNNSSLQSDTIPGNGLCEIPGGGCSFRAAVEESNAYPGADVINFNFPGPQIIPINHDFPVITQDLTINGGAIANSLEFGYDGQMQISIQPNGGGFFSGIRTSNASLTLIGLEVTGFNGTCIDINLGGFHDLRGLIVSHCGDWGILMSNVVAATLGGPNPADRNFIQHSNRSGLRIDSGYAVSVLNTYVGVDLDGNAPAPNAWEGIFIDGDALTIGPGNVISGNNYDGLRIISCEYCHVLGNKIGTNATGTATIPNQGFSSISISGSGDVEVGGLLSTERNIISGNNGVGLSIFNQLSGNILVRNNYIGTDVTGEFSLPNIPNIPQNGSIQIVNSRNITLGGVEPEARNLIAGNHGRGIRIYGGYAVTSDPPQSIQILNNWIGLNILGEALGNQLDGIALQAGSAAQIGDHHSQTGNVISNNGYHGVLIENSRTILRNNRIGTDPLGENPMPNLANGIYAYNSPDLEIGAPEAANVISANTSHGIEILGGQSLNSKIQANFIGTNLNGSNALGNGGHGILVRTYEGALPEGETTRSPRLTFIGGGEAGEGNVISGNVFDGIHLQGDKVNQTVIAGNRIGTDLSGQLALGNSGHGVALSDRNEAGEKIGGPVNTEIGGQGSTSLGGSCVDSCNLISGNLGHGISFNGTKILANRIRGNFIGTNLQGNAALSNVGSGVFIGGAVSNIIGGMPLSLEGPNTRGNLISGNGAYGIELFGSLTRYNQAYGNVIGLNSNQSLSLPNALGGILIDNAGDNFLGSDLPTSRNLISGNTGPGIWIKEGQSNTLQGNLIGLNHQGEALGNAGPGILITTPASGNQIGGVVPGLGNQIAHNQGPGIWVQGLISNALKKNLIYENSERAIEIGVLGREENDEGDSDLGPNLFQNYPLLTHAWQADTPIESKKWITSSKKLIKSEVSLLGFYFCISLFGGLQTIN